MLSLERQETFDRGLSRIARDALDRASGHLTDLTEDTGARVHDARRRLKEIRATLRLGRFALQGDFTTLNEAFRDAAREVAAVRDAAALPGAARALRAHAADPLERRALTRAA